MGVDHNRDGDEYNKFHIYSKDKETHRKELQYGSAELWEDAKTGKPYKVLYWWALRRMRKGFAVCG